MNQVNPQNLTLMNSVNQPQFLIQHQHVQQPPPVPQQQQRITFHNFIIVHTHTNLKQNLVAFLVPIGAPLPHYQYPAPQPQPQAQYYYPPIPPSQAFIPMIPSNITSIHQHLPKFPLLPLLSTETNLTANLSSASPSSQILSNIKDTKLFKTEDCCQSDNDSNSSTVSSKSNKNSHQQQYECSECGKSFKHKSNLK